ncbi:MAG TPA: hypothetical protein VF800_02490 [Telluria sp.]|jgi:hypothetical protein
MTITQVITPLPVAPNPATDPPAVFSEKAAAFVAQQQLMVPEINTWRIQANALETNVNAKEGSASGYATAAQGFRDTANFAADAAVGYRDQTQGWAVAAAASATTIGTTAAFSDANPMVKNATVNTKQGRFKATLITAATIRDYLLPDKDGTMALTSDMGSALVAGPLATTAVPYVDFLTLFSAGAGNFDNYDIILNRIQPVFAANSDSLCLRVANAGTVDTGNFYAGGAVGAGFGSLVGTITGPSIRGQDVQAGNIEIQIRNANSVTGSKTVFIRAIGNTSPAVSYQIQQFWGLYTGANAISGFRLYWATGANFAAGGSVRVYGWKSA